MVIDKAGLEDRAAQRARQARDDAGIELYGAPTGNCFRVSIAFEEAGVPYRPILVDLRRREHEEPAHLARNPAGRVPTIVDRSSGGTPITLSESNAIIFYIADKAPGRLFPDGSARARATAFERFFYFVTEVIGPTHGALLLRRRGSSLGVNELEQESMIALGAAERFLADAPFLAGETFTAADIAALTTILPFGQHADWSMLPNLGRWYREVRRRPGVERGLRAFEWGMARRRTAAVR